MNIADPYANYPGLADPYASFTPPPIPAPDPLADPAHVLIVPPAGTDGAQLAAPTRG
jgi:hypothetical protein